ncbi:MAG: hypothetical protein LBO78_01450 [Rickettsiales bacterium]|jgi:hypothetical protein|nr:hypothetical protein [Rickettsiales bacterium]
MFVTRSVLKNSEGGGVLLQVLLGLGVMVAMTPLILSQVRKYNEQINREEVVAQMQLIRKAVTSYVSFDKSQVPGGCQTKDGAAMKSALSNYGGNDLATLNSFGQTYYFITCKSASGVGGDIIEAAVGARGGGLSDVVLNGIGQYLFDQGAVLASDGEWLSNYSINLSAGLKSHISADPIYHGSLVMYVSDAFMLSDYLHINPMAVGATDSQMVNTMLTSLNMNGHNMLGIKNANGTKLAISKDLKVSALAGQTATFSPSPFSVAGVVEIQSGHPDTFISGKLPISPQSVDINKIETGDGVKVKHIDMEDGDLDTARLEVKKLSVSGDVNIISRPGDAALFEAKSLSADTLDSSGPGVNRFAAIKLNDDVAGSHSYIYEGMLDGSGAYREDSSSVINLSGVSEVVDVCWKSGCLSTKVQATHQSLMDAIKRFYEKAGELSCLQEGGTIDPDTGQCVGAPEGGGAP